jgi:hypothetical protein
VANIQTLSARLRAEIGDIGKSFEEQFTGDGVTKRFQLSHSPIKGLSLRVYVNGVNVSQAVSVEEVNGLFQLNVTPVSGAVIKVSGVTYKYFTDTEIQYYVTSAFYEHAYNSTDSNGSLATLPTLPLVEEYPLVLLASSMALYTLATDAAFDIDIISPDGVSIPRSERFRQLMEIVSSRKEQYRELCTLLGVGMYRIEVLTLRRISRRTNKYVPVYRPQEIDDGSIPQRVRLPKPNYWDTTPPGPAATKDLVMQAGDSFSATFTFDEDLTNYTPLSQIRLYPQIPGNQVGPLLLATFTITKTRSVVGGIFDQLTLTLPSTVTDDLPRTSYWDLQLTRPSDGVTRTYLAGKIYTKPQVTTTNGDFSV